MYGKNHEKIQHLCHIFILRVYYNVKNKKKKLELQW